MTPNISLLSKNSGSYTYNLLSNRLFLNAGRKCDNYVKLMYIGVQSGGGDVPFSLPRGISVKDLTNPHDFLYTPLLV